MAQNVLVSLAIPCYNEGGFIFESVKRMRKAVEGIPCNYEIILFDDKSTDSTAKNIGQIAGGHENIEAFFHATNMGRGRTVADAIGRARGKIVGFIDADLEVNEWCIPQMVSAIKSGSDVAIGWRKERIGARNLSRIACSKIYCALARRLLKVPLHDIGSGCKFFNREKILPILKQVKNTHWFWDTEVMALAHYNGLHIKEIPVAFKRNPASPSTVKPLSDAVHHINELLKFRKRMQQKKT